MNSQVERGTIRNMVHAIAFRAGVLEQILKEPVLGNLEVRTDELAHVQLLQRQIEDLRRYLHLPSAEPEERTAKVKEGWGFAVCECGQRVLPLEKYCSHCGARLEWE